MTTEAQNPDTTEDTTQPTGESVGTTPPEGAQTGTTQPAAAKSEQQFDPDTVEKIVKKRLDRERKKWEAEMEEARKKAEMSEAEKAQARTKELEAELEKERAARTASDRRAELTGKVRDPRAAMKLIEDEHVNEDGSVNVEAFLEAYPYFAPDSGKPTAKSATAPTPATGSPAKNPFARDTLNLTEQARLIRENPNLAAQLKAAAE